MNSICSLAVQKKDPGANRDPIFLVLLPFPTKHGRKQLHGRDIFTDAAVVGDLKRDIS